MTNRLNKLLTRLVGKRARAAFAKTDPDVVARVLSYGGGLDSWATLVTATALGHAPDAVVFCDVGDPCHQDPGEWPSTYSHIEEVVKPFCAEHGIEFVTVTGDDYPVRGERSLWAYLERLRSFPGHQSKMCTVASKVDRFGRWADDRYPDQKVEVWVGYEANEMSRVKNAAHGKYAERKPRAGKAQRVNRYPLVEWKFCRCRCEKVARAVELPVPRKSACVFCSGGSRGDFITLSRDLPDTFEKVADHELGCKLTSNGSKLAYFRKDGENVYLREAVGADVFKPYKAQKKPCDVCGRKVRATKAAGCDWLAGNEEA
jgi:hypothetical protein